MNKRQGSLISGLALVLLLIGSSAAAQPVRGFATYAVTVSSPKGDHSILVNESVQQSDKAGYSDLTLQVIGGRQNLTYSKLVNASENLFPYLPGIGTQSFDYSNGTAYKVQVNVTSSGTAPVTFKGVQYSLNVLVISVHASYGARSFRVNGTVETFPSTLVYSASVGNHTARLQAVLQATDLPLVPSSSSQMATAAYVGAGIGIGALAVGGAFLLRRREKKVEKQEEKPLHWVD